MSTFSKIEVKENLLNTINGFLKSVLETEGIEGILVPYRIAGSKGVMPTLVCDPEEIENADILAPSFPLSSAKIVSKLTKKPKGKKIAVVMRNCEIRAFVELIKLKQGDMDEIIIIGSDCLGAMKNRNYEEFAGDDPLNKTKEFYGEVLSGGSFENLSSACKVCEKPVPEVADIAICLYGTDYNKEVLINAMTDKGEEVVQKLSLPTAEKPKEREKVVNNLINERVKERDIMFDRISGGTGTINNLSEYLSKCVNCYNCRVACPVCYCKECVFVTDVFDHSPYQYLSWAKRKGVVKMPTDTVFFHLTRMTHIGLSCVGCGQCANACPNDIPVTELFRTISHYVQESFDYEAGRSIDEPIPLTVFKEREFEDVVGIT